MIVCYLKSYANLIFNTLGLNKADKATELSDDEIKNLCIKTKTENNNIINNTSFSSKIKYNKEFCCNFINDLHNKLKEKFNLESTEKILLNEVIFKKIIFQIFSMILFIHKLI